MRTRLHANDLRARDPRDSPFACESGCPRWRERRAVGARPIRLCQNRRFGGGGLPLRHRARVSMRPPTLLDRLWERASHRRHSARAPLLLSSKSPLGFTADCRFPRLFAKGAASTGGPGLATAFGRRPSRREAANSSASRARTRAARGADRPRQPARHRGGRSDRALLQRSWEAQRKRGARRC
jgi:hypothetical protein